MCPVSDERKDEKMELPELDWTAATDELLRQFPELEAYHRSAVAGSLVYAVARGVGIDPDLLVPTVTITEETSEV